jgi:phospholipid-binding lipoprotein MlaA
VNAPARRAISALAAAALLGGCAVSPAKDDPLEQWNRAMYAIHEPIDRNVVHPFIKAYLDYTPKLVRQGISNVFGNIDDLFSALNGFLQGRPDQAGHDLGRVITNTLVGLGGLFDVASEAGVPKGNTDFGVTFGVWGFPQGPYLFIPLFGPTTVRDGTGWLVRLYAGPVGFIPDVPLRNSLYGVGAVDMRAQAEDAIGFVDSAALDRYTFIRRAYLQRRQYLVNGGKPSPDTEEETP